MGLYNWMLEYRWGPVKTDLAADSAVSTAGLEHGDAVSRIYH